MHLLDSDKLTLLFEGHPKIIERLEQLPHDDVGITVVTRAEVLRGRIEYLLKAADGAHLQRAQELLARTEAFLSKMIVVPVDDQAAAHFDRLRLLKPLRNMGHADKLIASVALASKAILVTRNLRHFGKVPG